MTVLWNRRELQLTSQSIFHDGTTQIIAEEAKTHVSHYVNVRNGFLPHNIVIIEELSYKWGQSTIDNVIL